MDAGELWVPGMEKKALGGVSLPSDKAIMAWRRENGLENTDVSIMVSFEALPGDGKQTKLHVTLLDERGRVVGGWDKRTLAHYLRVAAQLVDEGGVRPHVDGEMLPVDRGEPSPGRNKPCNCGSSRKAKRCCYPD